MRKAVLALLVLVAGAAAAVLYAAWRHVVPDRDGPPTDPPGRDPQEVRFHSRDGTPLFGLFLPGRRRHPGVVLCHGYHRSLAEPFDLGLRLNREGYHVLLFDFRGCGRSGGRFTTLGYKETWDVLAAVDCLKARLAGAPIGILGISMGAAAAIMAAAQTQDVRALVLDSPYADLEGVMRRQIPDFLPFRWLVPFGWLSVFAGQLLSGGRLHGARPVDHIARIAPRPVLFIWGERERFIPHEQIGELFEAAGQPKEMWLAPGSDHAVARLDYPKEYERRVLNFFDRWLREHHRRPHPAHPEPVEG
ncbi:MAG TPA: alpha/beta fold hydrolase [Dehalococcoidia bacterium]|nr:alpha/beta fold hydrolase [Dehalococcoidia bacterium]